MQIEDFEACSGMLLYLDLYEKYEPNTGNTFIELAKGTLRFFATAYFLSIFIRVAMIWNLTLGLLKLVCFFLYREYQTDAFCDQIQTHFRSFFLDAISLKIHTTTVPIWSTLHNYWVLGFTFFPKETIDLGKYLRTPLYLEKKDYSGFSFNTCK